MLEKNKDSYVCIYNKYSVQIVWRRSAGILRIQVAKEVRRFYSFENGHEVLVYSTYIKCHVPCKHTLMLIYFQVPITNIPTVIHGTE